MTLNEKWILYVEHSNSIDPDGDKLLRLKRYRNKLLLACDWTQQPRATLTMAEREAAAVFIQTLKDLPQDFFDTPDGAVFPDPPLFLQDFIL